MPDLLQPDAPPAAPPLRVLTGDWRSEPAGSAHFDYLHSFRRENYLLGGRGTHKSGHLVAKAALTALHLHPHRGAVSYITEQTAAKVRDVLLPLIHRFVDPSLYRLRSVGQELDVIWSTGHVTRLRSRQAKSRHADPPFRGPSAVAIFHDEIARDPAPLSEDLDPIVISRAMLRGSPEPMILDCATTPVKNWFHRHVQVAGVACTSEDSRTNSKAAAWHVTTKDIDPAFAEYLAGTYSEQFAQQELYARWVPLLGRVWVDYSDEEWPRGNKHWHRYDRKLQTIWGVDLGGGRSAWTVSQLVPPIDRLGTMQPGYGERILVTVAESTPDHMGAGAVIDELVTKFGKPWRVFVGADYRTPGNAGDTAEREFLLRGIEAETITGDLAAKDIQYSHASAMIKDGRNRRRWCVSDGLVSLHADSAAPRGILTVMESDVWPSVGSTDYLEKDKRSGGVGIEDARDSWLYLLVGISPPQWYKQ